MIYIGFLMRKCNLAKSFIIVGIIIVALPAVSNACACGCNVFSVSSMWGMPTSSDIKMALLYDYMDQRNNWSNWHNAASNLNSDRELRTNFYTLGVQYMANREWGVMIDIPVWNRYFVTTDETGMTASAGHTSLADIRVMGIYTGLSEDMSTGMLFGVKLPTGSFSQTLLDRDTQIGTGTTDLLFGGYKMGQENGWGWYAQALYQHPLSPRDGYQPGNNFDVSIGMHYDNLLENHDLVPILQLIASFRSADSGINSDPDNTGYQRIYISPGIEVTASNHLSISGNLKIPIITHVRGYQLVAPVLTTVTLSCRF
jgi:hypothetical protein